MWMNRFSFRLADHSGNRSRHPHVHVSFFVMPNITEIILPGQIVLTRKSNKRLINTRRNFADKRIITMWYTYLVFSWLPRLYLETSCADNKTLSQTHSRRNIRH